MSPKLDVVSSTQVRRLIISAEIFFQLFAAGLHARYEVIDNAIPADARLIDVRFAWPDSIELIIHSAEFEPASRKAPIPLLNPVMRTTIEPK